MSRIKNLRREQIIIATLDLANEGGFYNVTTKKLSEKVGISESSLYNIYKSKDDVILDTLKFLHKRRLERIVPMFEKNFENIEQVVDEILNIMETHAMDEYCNVEISISSEQVLKGNEDIKKFLEESSIEEMEITEKILKRLEKLGLISLEGKFDAAYIILILLIGHVYYNLLLQDKNKNNPKLKIIVQKIFETLSVGGN